MSPRPWHTHEAQATLDAHGSQAGGLTAEEAARRLAADGPNELPAASERSIWKMLAAQLSDFMIVVLVAAAVVSGIVGEPSDMIAIGVIVVLNTTIGVFQEWRASRAMAALRQMAAAKARVRRDGDARDVPARELVTGDIVLIEAGNVVPADLRLIEAARLRHAEAALTGESQPVDKGTAALADAALPLGDRANMAWKGTLVAQGRGVGVVVATGTGTELGRIARLLAREDEVKTPLQKRLARFGTRLAWAVLAICAIVFVAGLLRGEEPALMFLTAVSLAVAAIPEALPAVVVIALAIGAARMVKQHALVRRLPAVETLGSITFICSDKTGTLTENRMRVEALVAPDGPAATPSRRLVEAMALVDDATARVVTDASGASRVETLGDPTEVALVEAARARGVDKAALDRALPRVAELPFDSERKRMATAHRDGDVIRVCVKGAPEAVLERCVARLDDAGADVPLSDVERARLLAESEALAARGLRVLALADKRLDALPADEGGLADPERGLEAGLTLLGLVGLMDPPRAEAAPAVAECRAAGIVPVMITGDHPATARAIAERLGILDAGGRVVSGVELAATDDEALARDVRAIRVYARVDPEQKIRIVKALQTAGEYAAMTGDGVNDAPALKRADIGVAMGRGGTDVAREAAHMVLLDDDFATIVAAVREGRRIFDNIRKFIKYTMTSNAGEIWTIFLAPLLGLPIPLLPIHILWINLVTDGLPGLALAAEPPEKNVMRRPPRAPDESIFAHGMWQHIIWVGLLMGAVCLVLQAWSLREGAHWQSMVFTVLCLSQLGHALAVRSERESTFTLGFWSNRSLMLTVVLTFGLQLATLYIPALNEVFHTEPLTLVELGICLAASSVVFVAVELEKLLVRRGLLYREPARRA
ncbi:MAG: cation-translocating P-type ATPase [Deltaproteobacteria bacterium]|nr:cation-translocating P-type ATPase [Deltaproteobacteria bacterium]